MIEEPKIVRTEELNAAVIRLKIPHDEIKSAMGPAIGEVLATVAAQGLAPIGPVFAHHFRMDPNAFDFEVGVPIAKGVNPAGRVKPGKLPAAEVARTVYRGPYEGLHAAWVEFDKWVASQKLVPAKNLWESYVAGPESGPEAKNWRTELNRPLKKKQA